ERFCKTAVGWVLREYSKVDEEFVLKFLSDFERWTTKEVVRNATKYIKRK
ncbi:MAG TPA: DNA alkylation repair protein, partial [Phaeodactylibacter sp.]|nr:DNA alkylation repair protein [Phaeodactylibacter sp.]